MFNLYTEEAMSYEQNRILTAIKTQGQRFVDDKALLAWSKNELENGLNENM